ncbi:MAG: ATP-binding protein [Acidobacteriia bacterium]|nr:ATP-binding protein [Terriglobia bacterium]
MNQHAESGATSYIGFGRLFVYDAAGHFAAGCADLRLLEWKFLVSYFRLADAERRLSAAVVRQQRPGGNAIRVLEEERRRLGRELHTGVGQMLAAVRLQAEVIGTQLPDAPAAVAQALERISALADDALAQVRSVSRRLHPPEWQRLAIQTALRQLWELSGIPQKFDASLRLPPLAREPGLELKILIYRAAQEAFSNVLRHARASRVNATLEAQGDRLILTVADDGVGFDVAQFLAAPASLESGIGLRAIREQAAAMGGKLAVDSGPNGTKLELSAPFDSTES